MRIAVVAAAAAALASAAAIGHRAALESPRGAFTFRGIAPPGSARNRGPAPATPARCRAPSAAARSPTSSSNANDGGADARGMRGDAFLVSFDGVLAPSARAKARMAIAAALKV